MTDYTPEGDEIKTVTMWLSFAEGDYPLTMDFTKFFAGVKSAEALMERHKRRRKVWEEAMEAGRQFEETMSKVQEIMNTSPAELDALAEQARRLGDDV